MNEKKIDTLLIIRGLLAVSVVIWHITAYNNTMPAVISIPGRTAVWFFFGISGYVISYGFFTKRYLLTGKSVKEFYVNRILRIYPLFLLLSVITLVTEYLLTGTVLIRIVDIPSQFLMLQFNHEYILSGVFWTLGIEVQFYLAVPLLIMLFDDKTRYFWWLAIYLLFLLWLPVAFYLFGQSFDGRNLISNLSHFFIGMIGCRLVLDNKIKKLPNGWLAGCIVAIILFTNYLYSYSIKGYWIAGTIMTDVAILLAIFLHAGMRHRTMEKKQFFLAALSFLGLISYGIYAWHPYLIKYIPLLENNILYAVIATVLVAFLSYKVVEQPIVGLKKKIQAPGSDKN